MEDWSYMKKSPAITLRPQSRDPHSCFHHLSPDYSNLVLSRYQAKPCQAPVCPELSCQVTGLSTAPSPGSPNPHQPSLACQVPHLQNLPPHQQIPPYPCPPVPIRTPSTQDCRNHFFGELIFLVVSWLILGNAVMKS